MSFSKKYRKKPDLLNYSDRFRVLGDALRHATQGFWMVASGRSMLPTVEDGDRIFVQPVSEKEIKPGDILVGERGGTAFFHRLLIKGCNWLVTKGDNASAVDPPWRVDSVLGKVTKVERPNLTCKPGRRRIYTFFNRLRANLNGSAYTRMWRNRHLVEHRFVGMTLATMLPESVMRSPFVEHRCSPWRVRGGYSPWILNVTTTGTLKNLRLVSGANYQMDIDLKGNRLHLRSHRFRANFDRARRIGWLSCFARDADASLENALRVLIAWHLNENDGVLLHASAVVRDGGAYVFVGHSGLGKSTIAAHAAKKDMPVISDDLVAIRYDRGDWIVEGLPFRGSHPKAQASFGRFPLAGVFLLRQAEEDRVEEISVASAIAELSSCVPFTSQNQELADRQMTFLAKLAKACRVRRLFFERSNAFWKVLEDHAQANSSTRQISTY